MRKYIINPNIFHHELHFAIVNFHCTPVALPGTRFLVHKKPKREQDMLLMDYMDGTFSEHHYNTDTSNIT